MLELCIQIAQLVGPVVGSALLLLGPYIPFYFVFPIAILSIPLALLLPPGGREGRYVKSRTTEYCAASQSPAETEGLLNSEGHNRHGVRAHHGSLKAVFSEAKSELSRSWHLTVGYRVIQYGYAASLVVTLGKQALHILLQYVSKRFDVSIAEVRAGVHPDCDLTNCWQAGFLFSIKAIVVTILYMLILPAAQRTLRGTQAGVTVRIARVSILFLALGVTGIGFAWNIGSLIPGELITLSLP
jgi:hypothetical protein